ncbi:YifB family Mg chelatase-like AAA ATPase [Limisalsivibrio acetivorans]|uniref:YifB family Mg chelatase-like AAA ATPase n=1 Tax=Limisalsivibrio acetivorans TaxID=1304888 RepID=UPI0003B620A3|nr:YifB family Mg chelatase-like AAA ATPase [Limisalsivibrio acetivorans]
MFSKIYSAHLSGIEGVLIDVEVDMSSNGLPAFGIVGLAEASVRESKDRVRSALKNIGFNIFTRPITVNLAPADFKKEGTRLDLPMAVGLLKSAKAFEGDTDETIFIGELSLDGRIRPVSGILPIASSIQKKGFRRIVLPEGNVTEASLVDGLEIVGVENLSQVLAWLMGREEIKPVYGDASRLEAKRGSAHDFRDVKGQYTARRASLIAAAGMHNILMIGPPGSGKTMIARRLPGILPPMATEDALETLKIHSVAGTAGEIERPVLERPFIAPHHTSSNAAIIGGTGKALPGHVSLAHNGILFLDEMLEFNRSLLETLRQPLEDRIVTVARAGKTVTYPSSFMLVGACNPCPCGYFGDKKRECTCSQSTINKYRMRLSGPLLDRIDIHMEMQAVELKELAELEDGEPSESMADKVLAAREAQNRRFGGNGFNAGMSEQDIKKHCRLDDKSMKMLENACDKYGYSARAYAKILKVARSIADLESSSDIQSRHILEALHYRVLDRQA